jgi:hypothetical protein
MGIYSGSGSVGYFSSKNISRYAEQLLISIMVKNETQLMRPHYSLTAESLKALHKSKQDFINLCGDTYLAGKISGGEFTAVFNFAAATEAEQQDMHANFSAASGSNSVDAALSEKLKTSQQSQNLDVEVIRKGPNEPMPPLEVQKLIEYALNYPPKVAAGTGNAWTIAYVTLPYGEVLDTSDTLPVQNEFLTSNSSYLRQLYSRKSGLLFIASHRASFAPFDPNRLK